MIAVSCPSCSARVEFKSSASILAVCEHCRSTLIRHDMDIENLGVMAQLKTDSSPIQLGVEGRYNNIHFTVIGRIQLQYENGVWNEWHIAFDDNRSGWLGEAQGIYTVTFLKEVSQKIPFDKVKFGQQVGLDKSRAVVNIEEARCIAGEGELPFKVESGHVAPVVDLHGDGTAFGTLDYSESMDEPLVFLGEYVEFDDLGFKGLRRFDDESPTSKRPVKTFRCPQCGASVVIRGMSQTASLACESCSTTIDITDENYRILSAAISKLKVQPDIPLGTRGTFRGQKFEVIGFQRRCLTVEGIGYRWHEYLLFNPYIGFRWLTDYNGHWNFVHQTVYRPKSSGDGMEHRGTHFKHFQSGTDVKTEFVLGEFYWKVSTKETFTVVDFIAPPQILSKEKSGHDVSWSVGTYVDAKEIEEAFGLKKPLRSPVGVYANQPSPYAGQISRVWKLAGIFALLAVLIQGGTSVIAQNKQVLAQQFVFTPNQPDNAQVTPVFDLTGRTSNVVVRSRAGVSNSWVFLSMALINDDTGTAYDFGREIGYYSGVDSDGPWTEGSSNDETVLPGIPAGRYYLRIEPEGPAQATYNVAVIREVPRFGPFFVTMGLLLVFPIFRLFRNWSFEHARWAESDHPWSGSSSGGDDE